MREMREAAVVVRPYTLAEEPLGERDRVHVLRAVVINIPGLEAPFVERISTGLTTENIPVRNYADLVCLCAKRERLLCLMSTSSLLCLLLRFCLREDYKPSA